MRDNNSFMRTMMKLVILEKSFRSQILRENIMNRIPKVITIRMRIKIKALKAA